MTNNDMPNGKNGSVTSNGSSATYCQKFHLGDIDKGTNTIICGRRLTGKSQLLCEILQSRPDAKVAIFASKYVAPSYKKYFAPDQVHEQFDSKALKTLLDQQYQQQQDYASSTELVIAFDDVRAANRDLWRDPFIRETIRYGSSLGITAIFLIQYAGQLDDMFKRNIDYVFCFRDNIIDNQKLMFTEFAGMFPSFHEFKVVLDECIAEPYRCLVFDLKTPRKDPRQSVFWYKATDTLKRYVPEVSLSERTDKQSAWLSLFGKR